MTNNSIYRQIAVRTGGDIYIGVVGPVRTGKSTFIKRFFEKIILPEMTDVSVRERTIDELPQSSAGRTIMTTEPKFVPEKAAEIEVDKNVKLNIRMIDCVGYIVPSSLGYFEEEAPRMVKTPWFEEEIPFNMAAEIGTKKVITDHSTIGIVVTGDGSITDIPREEYKEAEERVIDELKELNKPFIVLLNCMYPQSVSALQLADEMQQEYGVPVMPVNCLELEEEEIRDILQQVLYEFPVRRIDLRCPSWFSKLENAADERQRFLQYINDSVSDVHCLRSIESFSQTLSAYETVSVANASRIDASTGVAEIDIGLNNDLFYSVLSDVTGLQIHSDAQIIETMKDMAAAKKRFEKFEAALKEVDATGYGIVMPTLDELKLEEPEIMKQGGRYGVRLKASAPSIHMMKADITTEVAPIVGSEKQSEDLIVYLLSQFEESPSKIWESNIFGTSLNELVNEGLRTKLTHMPHDARMKIQQTLERVINEGCSGLICIII